MMVHYTGRCQQLTAYIAANIDDDALTASSYYQSGRDHGPTSSHLFTPGNAYINTGGWVSVSFTTNEYIQVRDQMR